MLAALGLAAWDVVPVLVLGNAGTAELWTGDRPRRRSTCVPRGDIDRSGGVLRPHLNAAAHLALLQCERGDLDAAQTRRVPWSSTQSMPDGRCRPRSWRPT